MAQFDSKEKYIMQLALCQARRVPISDSWCYLQIQQKKAYSYGSRLVVSV